MRRFIAVGLVFAAGLVMGMLGRRSAAGSHSGAGVPDAVEIMHPAALVGDAPRGQPFVVVRAVDESGAVTVDRASNEEKVVWRVVLVRGDRKTFLYLQSRD